MRVFAGDGGLRRSGSHPTPGGGSTPCAARCGRQRWEPGRRLFHHPYTLRRTHDPNARSPEARPVPCAGVARSGRLGTHRQYGILETGPSQCTAGRLARFSLQGRAQCPVNPPTGHRDAPRTRGRRRRAVRRTPLHRRTRRSSPPWGDRSAAPASLSDRRRRCAAAHQPRHSARPTPGPPGLNERPAASSRAGDPAGRGPCAPPPPG